MEEPLGGFYVVQPIPSIPGHLKLGFATDFQKRLKVYQSLCPDARILHSWIDCADVQTEKQAIAYIADKGYKRIGPEVFLCDDPQAVIDDLDYFFREVARYSRQDLMPMHLAMAELNLSRAAVLQLITSGQLHEFKIGKEYWFLFREVVALENAV